MREATGNNYPLALVLIDLERLKNINDNLGQSAGDSLLQQVAEWMTQTLGNDDRVARIGADQCPRLRDSLQAGTNCWSRSRAAIKHLMSVTIASRLVF